RPPFVADTPVETLLLVRCEEPVAPARLRPALPRDLETICLKCLQKDPKRRYATAQALADDLGRFLDGQPIQARPVPAWERAWKWGKRRPALVGLGAAAVLVLVLGVAGGVYFQQQTQRARERAQQAGQQAEAGLAQADQLRRAFRFADAREMLAQVG